ncbi:hypothetical protein AO376_1436 [Moraxella catarrhalis]|nr:hypothetical protein AO376_1436 [Moraxella catarrhalis]OAV19550.1 hypothetical protein AO374_0656 [Moraxella catarrhalis]
MMAVSAFEAPATPLVTVANFTPSAPTWICSLPSVLLTDKPPLFRVLLPTLRPSLVLMPKVTVPFALLVVTVRPFSPLSFRVLTCSSFVSLPTVMVSSSLVASCFLTVKVCRAVPAIFLASLAAILALSALVLASAASLADVAACSLAFSAAVLAALAVLVAVLAAVSALSALPLALSAVDLAVSAVLLTVFR